MLASILGQSRFFEAAIVRIGTSTQRPVCSRLGFVSSLGWVECGRTFERWDPLGGLLAIGDIPLEEIMAPQPLQLSFCFASCHGLLPWCIKKWGDSRTEISQTVGQIKPFLFIMGLSWAFVTVTDLWLTLVPNTCNYKMNTTAFPQNAAVRLSRAQHMYTCEQWTLGQLCLTVYKWLFQKALEDTGVLTTVSALPCRCSHSSPFTIK